MTNPECVTCRHLGNCPIVTPDKILSHYRCDNWEEVSRQEKVKARCDIITKYGESGLRALISPDSQEA